MRTVARYQSTEEAYIAKALLEAAEIRVLIDENEAFGGEVIFLKVDELDLSRARQILEDDGEGVIPACETLLPETPGKKRDSLPLLFVKGGAWAIFGIFGIFLLLLPFGRLLHLNWVTAVIIFVVGGLLALILGANDE